MKEVVLITGTEDINAAKTAEWFAARGYAVYAAMPAGQEQAAQPGDGIIPLSVDPLDEMSLQAAVDRVGSEQGKLDILVLGTGCFESDGAVDGISGIAGDAAGCAGEEAGSRVSEATGHDYGKVLEQMTERVIGSKLLVEAFLPLLRQGRKRIAAVTSIESSNSWSTEKADYARHMSLAAMNMMGKVFFNRLRPEGFTFRWYCADGVSAVGDMTAGIRTVGNVSAESALAGCRGICAGEYIAAGLCYDEKEPYIHSDENRLVMRDGLLREISW